jgi:hypothetical protein
MVRSNKKCKPFFTRTKARSAPIERVVLPGKLHGNPFNFSSLRRICHVSDHQEHTGSSRRSSLELDLKMPPMHWRSFVLALAAHLACGLPAAGAPAMNPMPQIAVQEFEAPQPVRWRHRWSRDYDASGWRGTANLTPVLPAELYGLLDNLNRDARRRQGWLDPPPPQ